jgi:hypothetical protein
MDKKVLAGIVDAMVQRIVEQNAITEPEARALLGMALRKMTDRVVEACKVPEINVG